MTLRVGLIGCGKYCAESHAPAIAESGLATIVAISECSYPGELADRQRQFGVSLGFADYREMLRSVELDAAVISTPHARHFAQAQACLAAGLHVLADKPPACRSEEARSLADAAEERARQLVVACPRRYDPAFREVRNRITEGQIGELRLIEALCARDRRTGFAASWRNDPALSGGGVLSDAGYSVLDAILWLTGRGFLDAHGQLGSNGAAVETSVSLSLSLTGGLAANVSMHLEAPPRVSREEFAFYGSEGAIVYRVCAAPNGRKTGQLCVVRGRECCEETVDRKDNFDQSAALNFLAAILGREPAKSSGRDAVDTVEAIESIYRLLRN